MRRRLPLSALRAFESAARHGSFSRAAGELAVTPTAVSHQIRSLEESLGVPLFERRARKVALTEAGSQLYPVLRDGFDAFEGALERLARIRTRAAVTVSATNAFTSKWLLPRVASFTVLHPQIDLQLHASDEAVDLVGGGVDIAIRYGRGPYPGLLAEPMFADDFAPVVNPRLGVRVPSDLDAVPIIHFQWKRHHPLNPTWEAWFARAGLAWRSASGELRFSDESHAIQAAVAGQGAALLSLALVRDEIAAGQLVQPFGPVLAGHAYHLVTDPERATSPSVSAALEWLRAQVRGLSGPAAPAAPGDAAA
ncbi:LysR substrate-binding domain-containing protein [Lysobacter sp. CA199]|uniref:LysR substrate-binding domain-containing protein n=1 Tax=Lysobacter sp. CA199 TaxID=3455608 RepID=UPI003F8D36A0